MCAFASKQVCFRSDFIIIMNYLTSYVFFFLFSSTMDAARDRETWTQKVEAVLTCWGAGVYISVTYKCTHAHIHLYARPSFPLLPEPLLHQEKKINSKTKGSHWPAHKSKNNINSVLHEWILQGFFFFSSSSCICARLRSPELQVKGNDLTFVCFTPLEGTLRLWAALTVRIGAGRAGVRVRVAVVVLWRALFPQSPLDGSETSQQTLVVKTTSLLPKRILQDMHQNTHIWRGSKRTKQNV